MNLPNNGVEHYLYTSPACCEDRNNLICAVFPLYIGKVEFEVFSTDLFIFQPNQQSRVLGVCVILTWPLPKSVKLLAGTLKMSSGPVSEVGCLSP